jgi:hypothetical protein
MKAIRLLVGLAVLNLLAIRAEATTFYVDVNSTNPTPPYADLTTAAVSIQDAVDAATNGDLILVNDGVYQNGYRVTKHNSSGFPTTSYDDTNRVVLDKPVTVQSLNGSAAAFINGGGVYRCVYLTNNAVLSGFTLTNGVAGWIATTQTFHGPVTTTNASEGGGVAGTTPFGSTGAVASNCVLIANMAYCNGGGAYGVGLVNCTVAGNTAKSGGGACFAALVNCLVTGNSAQTNGISFSEPYAPSVQPGGGGGLNECSAANCLIVSNNAFEGGGVYNARGLENCTIVNNSAASYGGVYLNGLSSSPYAYATNCIIYFNNAGTNANFGATNLFSDRCCTTPMPVGGIGNITNDPTFVNYAGGDFHLQSNSPCINSGNHAANTNSTDLDGNPRIVGGTVDIGAYEFQTPASVLSYAWAMQYGLPTDGSADYVDSDGDGMNNWQEFIAGTDPTNAVSVLQMTTAYPANNFNWAVVKWQSVNTRTYYLQRSTNLGAQPSFTTIQSNIVGEAGTTITIDATATNGSAFFYRVGVQ